MSKKYVSTHAGAAVDQAVADIGTLKSDVGTKSSLKTTNKTNLVSAINEINDKMPSLTTQDGNKAVDANYVHTDNNFTNAAKASVEKSANDITDLALKVDSVFPSSAKTLLQTILSNGVYVSDQTANITALIAAIGSSSSSGGNSGGGSSSGDSTDSGGGGTTPSQPSGDYIVWEDSVAEQIALARYDTDGDGKISYEEAAAVTSMSVTTSPFKNTEITSLNELQYFTGAINANNVCDSCIKLTSVVVPANIATCRNPFDGCTNLATITFVGLPTSIGVMFARNDTALQTISIPSSVTNIGQYAFAGCSNLVSINLPSGITEIGTQAFNGCSKLVFDELPSSLTNIGATCFKNCTSLGKIKLLTDSVPTLGSATAFPSNAKIFVKEELLAEFKSTDNWSTIQSQIYSINDWNNY